MKPDDTKGNELVVTGVGVGAAGAVGAAVLGVACPACVVIAPALVGAGLYKRWNFNRRARLKEKERALEAAAAGSPQAEADAAR